MPFLDALCGTFVYSWESVMGLSAEESVLDADTSVCEPVRDKEPRECWEPLRRIFALELVNGEFFTLSLSTCREVPLGFPFLFFFSSCVTICTSCDKTFSGIALEGSEYRAGSPAGAAQHWTRVGGWRWCVAPLTQVRQRHPITGLPQPARAGCR